MQQNNNTKYINIIKGSLAGVILLVVAIALSAFAVYKGNISEKAYIPLMILSVILSGAISGFISTTKTRKNGLTNGLIASLPISVILLIVMSVANSAFDIFMLIPCVLMVISGGAGGIAAVNTKHKIKKK